MPRLLRTVARTAAIAGTASAVSGRVQHRQAERFASRDAQTAPEPEQELPPQPSAPGTADVLEQLKTLGELKAQGVLTEAEFSAEKAKILGR